METTERRSEEKNDGGQAFPTGKYETLGTNLPATRSVTHPAAPGMSLRAYYAGKAMEGICSNYHWTDGIIKATESPEEMQANIITQSIDLADDMIAKLNEKN